MKCDKCVALHHGKKKSVYETENPHYCVIKFEAKKNNYFNAFVMQTLADEGIPTHFERLISENESLVKRLQMIPLVCVVRNFAAGNLCKRLGVEEGTTLTPAIFEFFLKDQNLNFPMVNEHYIHSFGWATMDEIARMKICSYQVNTILKAIMLKKDLILVDFKLKFGRFGDTIIVGDDITPENCRVWGSTTKTPSNGDEMLEKIMNRECIIEDGI